MPANAVKVMTSSDLIAFLLLLSWHILLIVLIFFLIKRIINCLNACFIPLQQCETADDKTFCEEQWFDPCFFHWSYYLPFHSVEFFCPCTEEALLVLLLILSLIFFSLCVLFQVKQDYSNYCF